MEHLLGLPATGGRVVSVDRDQITVEVEVDRRMLILGLANLADATVIGRATAPWARRDGVTRSDTAAYAVNWRTVVVVDALLGLAMVAAGIILAVRGAPLFGAPLAAVGLVYAVLVVRRWRRWRRLRAEAGL